MYGHEWDYPPSFSFTMFSLILCSLPFMFVYKGANFYTVTWLMVSGASLPDIGRDIVVEQWDSVSFVCCFTG